MQYVTSPSTHGLNISPRFSLLLTPATFAQQLPRPPLKRINHQPRHLRRRRLTQRTIHRTREPHLQHKINLCPRSTWFTRLPLLRRLPIRRWWLEWEFLERPSRQQRREYRRIPRTLLTPSPVIVVVVWQFPLRNRGLGVSGYGFQNCVGKAVYRTLEYFFVGTIPDFKVGGAGPAGFGDRVGS